MEIHGDEPVTIASILDERLNELMREIRRHDEVSNKDVRAMLGMQVLEHLLDDHEKPEIPEAMELFFAEVRLRVLKLLAEGT